MTKPFKAIEADLVNLLEEHMEVTVIFGGYRVDEKFLFIVRDDNSALLKYLTFAEDASIVEMPASEAIMWKAFPDEFNLLIEGMWALAALSSEIDEEDDTERYEKYAMQRIMHILIHVYGIDHRCFSELDIASEGVDALFQLFTVLLEQEYEWE